MIYLYYCEYRTSYNYITRRQCISHVTPLTVSVWTVHIVMFDKSNSFMHNVFIVSQLQSLAVTDCNKAGLAQITSSSKLQFRHFMVRVYNYMITSREHITACQNVDKIKINNYVLVVAQF